MNILFLSSEVAPFSKTGGLADVAGSLPQALRRFGHDVRIVTPAYRSTQEKFTLATTDLAVAAPMAGFTETARIVTADLDGVPVYFVDHPGYFDRAGCYGPPSGGDFPDNAERFGFFCRAALELCKALDFRPDVIHGNDWQCGPAPVMLRTLYRHDPHFAGAGTLCTIHNLGYQGHFPPAVLASLGLPPDLFHMEGLEFYGGVSFLKGGIVFSDVVNTVSDTYCREIQTPEYGHGFDGILRSRHNRLFGVLNGIAPEEWNPARLPETPYTIRDLSAKGTAKAALQRELGLTVDPSALLMVMVSRLDRQKGFDLIEAIWERMMGMPLQFALLGSGDPELSTSFAARALEHPDRVALRTGFDEELARRFYAGGDLFLMPSRYEPCGLSQLISLRYGTLPLVRHTGGLADTVVDVAVGPGVANGFTFADYTPQALLTAVERALTTFRQQTTWQGVMRYAMQQDFSWELSARRYQELYRLVQGVVDERP